MDWLTGRMPLPPLHRFAEGPPPEWIKQPTCERKSI
jgi:hypothetical protein